MELEFHEEGMEDFEEAIRLQPDNSFSYFNRGHGKYQLGLIKESIPDYNKVIQLEPNHIMAYSHRALAYADLGRIKEAMLDLEKSMQLIELIEKEEIDIEQFMDNPLSKIDL